MTHTLTEFETIIRLWPIFVGIILLVVWLVRLESGMLHNKDKLENHKKDLDDHKKNVKENEGKVWDKLDTIKEQNTGISNQIARLEGKLEKEFYNETNRNF